MFKYNPLEVVSWNLRDGINNPEIQRTVLDFEPDVAVFAEAHRENTELEAATRCTFVNAGYSLFDTRYDDNDDRLDRHNLLVIAKPELINDANIVRLAGRSAVVLSLRTGSEFMGVHLDDRHEKRRVDQAKAISRLLGATATVAGDFNSMHKDDKNARRLRKAGPLARLLPSRDPGQKQNKLQRLGSLSQRLTEMASGEAMALLVDHGFKDADPSHAVTMKKGPIAGQLDHILYRGKVEVKQPTTVEDAGGLTDHKLIHATLWHA